MSNSFTGGENSAKPLLGSSKRQAVGGGDGGGAVLTWQSGKGRRFGNNQCDLGHVAYLLSLGFCTSKMEIRQGGCESYKCKSVCSFILDVVLSCTNL